MGMTLGKAARPVFNENALDALAGNVRQFVLVDEADFGGVVVVCLAAPAAASSMLSAISCVLNISISFW